MPLALALLMFLPVQQSITLEVRTFDGTADVSDATRVVVHRAAQRDQPVGQINPGARPTITVPPGIYDAQAIREQAGRLANIRWAERLIVMPYPDENGYHLEVINFQTGYGGSRFAARQGVDRRRTCALHRQRSRQARGGAADDLDVRALRGEHRRGPFPRPARRAQRLASTHRRAGGADPAVDSAVSRGVRGPWSGQAVLRTTDYGLRTTGSIRPVCH